MKNPKKLISILLLAAGIFALCLGCMEVVRRISDTHQTMQTPHTDSDTIVSSDIDESDAETAVANTETDNPADTTETSRDILSGSESTETSAAAERESAATETSSVNTEISAKSTTESSEPYISPYDDYFTKYPDLVAWFQIPGTNIDYPVMWTPGDETYYLYRNYDGSDNINGSLLLDTDSSLSPLTTNLIIHGHNMKSGAMFGNLPKYEDKNYYEQHKEMLLYTPDGEHRYEVIAVFRSHVFKKSDTCFKYYKFFQADTEEEFNDFYDNIKALSIYDTGVTAEFGDHFITLSTCVSHVENGRFVVVAKEITQE